MMSTIKVVFAVTAILGSIIGGTAGLVAWEDSCHRVIRVENYNIVERQIDDFGYGKVVEIYHDWNEGIVLENAKGLRVIASRGEAIPVRGDWYSLRPQLHSNNVYYVYLKDRIYNGIQETLQIDVGRNNVGSDKAE